MNKAEDRDACWETVQKVRKISLCDIQGLLKNDRDIVLRIRRAGIFLGRFTREPERDLPFRRLDGRGAPLLSSI